MNFVSKDFTLDIDIRQTWVDPRLRWKDVPIKDIKIKGLAKFQCKSENE